MDTTAADAPQATTTAPPTPPELPSRPQTAPPEDLLLRIEQAIHTRIDELAARLCTVEEKIAAAVAGVAADAEAPLARLARAVKAVAECPDHPDAVQSPNGCTEPGCSYLSPVGR